MPIHTAATARLIACLLPPAALVLFLIWHGLRVPYWDAWELAPLLERWSGGTLEWRHLWRPHNAHRIVLPRLIMLVLAEASNWNHRWELALNALLGLGIFAVWARLAFLLQRYYGLAAYGWLYAALSLGVFSLAQWRNWMWGWQMQIFLCVLLSLLALLLLLPPGGQRPRAGLALICAVLASFSFAAGLAVWPAGILGLALHMALVQQRGVRRAVLLWSAAGLLTCALYLYGFETPSGRAMQPFSAAWVFESIVYLFAFLGGPLFPWAGQGAACAGALMTGAWVALGARLIWKQPRARAALPLLSALFLAALGSAALSAFGRGEEGISHALASRYATLALPAALSLLLISAMVLMQTQGPFRAVTSLALSLLLLLLAASSTWGWHEGSQRGDYYNAARMPLLRGEPPEGYARLYPAQEKLEARREWLERNHYSVFSGDAP